MLGWCLIGFGFAQSGAFLVCLMWCVFWVCFLSFSVGRVCFGSSQSLLVQDLVLGLWGLVCIEYNAGYVVLYWLGMQMMGSPSALI